MIVCLFYVDTVTGTVTSTLHTTKNVAASAYDKGASLIGSSKGIPRRENLQFF